MQNSPESRTTAFIKLGGFVRFLYSGGTALEQRMAESGPRRKLVFIIPNSTFFRHSGFVIRHSPHASRLSHRHLLFPLGAFRHAVGAAARGGEGQYRKDVRRAALAGTVGAHLGAGIAGGVARLVFVERGDRLRLRRPRVVPGASAYWAASHDAAHPLPRGADRCDL